MVSSKGILRRMLSSTLCIVLLGLCTGCNVADMLRPDLNLNDGLRIMLVQGTGGDGTTEGPDVTPGDTANIITPSTWSGGSPNTGSFQYKNPNRDQDASEFVATPKDMVEATDYGTYLRQQVYEKLLAEIKTLDSSVQDKLYLRVAHTGYDYLSKDTCKRVAGYSATTAGRSVTTAQVVGGTTLITLADDWVGPLDINSSHKDSQVSYAQSSIRSYVSDADFSKDWYALAGSNLPAIYYKMMGRDSGNFSTLQGYYDAIATDPFRNIPNYKLYYYTGVNTTNNMVFNQVSGNVMDRYVEGVPLSTVEKLCSTYNQYIKRDRAAVTNTVTDDDSILKYYLDGYNKTVIFLGTTTGGDLKSLVGATVYNRMCDTISKAYVCTDTSKITSISQTVLNDATGEIESRIDYSDFAIIPAGSKGVD